MAKDDNLMKFGIAIVLGIVLWQSGFFASMGIGEAADTDDGIDLQTLAGCAIEDTTVTVSLQEKFNPTTMPTGGYAYKVMNANNAEFHEVASNKVSGDELTLSPGDKIQIIYAGNATSTTGTGWAHDVFSFTVPCSGTYRKHLDIWDFSGSDPLSIKAFNSDFSNIADQGTNCEAVAAGGTGTIEVTIEGTYEDSYGRDGMLVCIEYNSTSYDEIALSEGTATTKPAHLSTGAGSSELCWEFGGIESNEKIDFLLSYDGHDVTQPEELTGNLTLTLVDRSAFRNDDNLNYEYGYEDERDNDIGYADVTKVLCFT